MLQWIRVVGLGPGAPHGRQEADRLRRRHDHRQRAGTGEKRSGQASGQNKFWRTRCDVIALLARHDCTL